MRYMIGSLIVAVIAFMVASHLLPGFTVDSWTAAAIGAVLLGVVNAVIRPIIILFTLPVTVLTLGLFLLVINGLMLYFVVSLVPGIHVTNFGWSILAALIISLINAALGSLLG